MELVFGKFATSEASVLRVGMAPPTSVLASSFSCLIFLHFSHSAVPPKHNDVSASCAGVAEGAWSQQR